VSRLYTILCRLDTDISAAFRSSCHVADYTVRECQQVCTHDGGGLEACLNLRLHSLLSLHRGIGQKRFTRIWGYEREIKSGLCFGLINAAEHSAGMMAFYLSATQ